MILSMRFRNSKVVAELEADLLKLENALKMNPAMREIFKRWAEQYATPALQESARTNLTVRTGKLSSRARAIAGGTRDRNFRLTVGAPYVPYALIHDTGGVITPKKSQYLTIPVPGSPADVYPRKSARSFQDTFVSNKKSKKTRLIFQRKGNQIIPLFFLKKLVKVPPREWISKAMEESVPILRDMLKNAGVA